MNQPDESSKKKKREREKDVWILYEQDQCLTGVVSYQKRTILSDY